MEQFFLSPSQVLLDVTLQSPLTFISTIDYDLITSRILASPVAFVQTIDYDLTRSITIPQTLTFTQTIDYEYIHEPVHPVIIVHTLSFDQTIEFDLLSRTLFYINQTLPLTQHIVLQKKTNLHVSHTLTFKTSRTQRLPLHLPDQDVEIPNIIIKRVPKKCTIVLIAVHNTIVLPCPLLGDSQSNLSELKIKRTMTGLTYSYVKKTNAEKLNYTFRMDRNKAMELRTFLRNNLSEKIGLLDWKGESWIVYLTNNPISMLSQNLRSLCTNETVEVQLEFQGIQMS